MGQTTNHSSAAKLQAAESALKAAITAFSDFDNSTKAWRKLIDAESECRKALDLLAAQKARASTDLQVNSRRFRFLWPSM
jgi:hypothetical protein